MQTEETAPSKEHGTWHGTCSGREPLEAAGGGNVVKTFWSLKCILRQQGACGGFKTRCKSRYANPKYIWQKCRWWIQVGRNWWGEKQTAFSLCFLPECTQIIPRGVMMFWEAALICSGRARLSLWSALWHPSCETLHRWLRLQGQWFCSSHRHYACSKRSKKMQCFCWQVLHVESSSFSICWCSNVTLDCFKVTISVPALLKLSNKAWICYLFATAVKIAKAFVFGPVTMETESGFNFWSSEH